MKNQNQAIVDALAYFGLKKNEISVYLAILGLGRGTVSEISRKAGINRTTGYHLLDCLVSKELVRISGKEPKQEYVAESPDNILKIPIKRLEAAKEDTEKAEELVPQLHSIHKVGNRPQIKFYEGIEGMKRVYEDTLTSTEEIRAYGNYDENYAVLKDYLLEYMRRRAEKKIHVRAIAPDTRFARERKANDTKEDREIALVSPERFSISPEIDVYDNKVVISSWEEKLGIIIESREIADAMKQIFELAWDRAKQMNTTINDKRI